MILTLADLVGQGAARWPGAAALRHAGHTRDYATLWAETGAAARGLVAAGLAPGERLAVWTDKRPEAVVALLAAGAAAAAFVPIHPGLKPPQVAHVLADAGAAMLLTTPARWALLAPALADGGAALREVLLLDTDAAPAAAGTGASAGAAPVDAAPAPAGSGAAPGPGAPPTPTPRLQSWSALCATGAATDPPTGAAPATGPAGRRPIDADLAALLYTSGSTGRPKGVALSHRNLVEGARSVAAYLPLRPDDVVLAVLPLSFDYGLNQLSQCFLVGACAVLHDHLLPRDVLQALAREGATALAGVPPLWMQLAALDWPPEVVRRLRFVTNSGGAMPGPTLARLRAALPHTAVVLMYGLTEAFRSTWLPPEQLDRRPDSIGRAIPNAEVLVLREDGSVCADGEVGELVHRGVHVALGYWNDPARTAERFRPLPARLPGLPLAERAVWSGDLVRRDAEGYLYFVGRRDDQIKCSGYRVSPTEVEEVALAVPGVVEAAAFGLPHPQWGQAIGLALVLADGTAPDEAAVLRACRQALASHQQPAHLVFGHAPLPRNPNGKIDRARLAEAHRGRFTAAPAPDAGRRGPVDADRETAHADHAADADATAQRHTPPR